MYSGFLIRLGDYEVPKSYIQRKTYKTRLSVIDVDSKRNANGNLIRNALDDKKNIAEFQTVPCMSNIDVAELFSNISRNYIIPKERKILATLYVPEIDDYMTQELYIQDPEFIIDDEDEDTGLLYYEPMTIAFTAY